MPRGVAGAQAALGALALGALALDVTEGPLPVVLLQRSLELGDGQGPSMLSAETEILHGTCQEQFEACWDLETSAWDPHADCKQALRMCRFPLCTGRLQGYCGDAEHGGCGALDTFCANFEVRSLRNKSASLLRNTTVEDAAPRLEFVHIPKNAGTSIEDVARVAGYDWGFYNEDMARRYDFSDVERCNAYHVPPRELLENDLPSPYNNGELFCVIRHPYQRIVSEYQYMLSVSWGTNEVSKYGNSITDHPRCSAEALNAFTQRSLLAVHQGMSHIQDCHFIPQSDYIWSSNGTQLCTHILHFENLTSEFNELMSNYGYPITLDMAPVNSHASRCPDLSDANFTEHTLKMLDAVYLEDMFRLGFRGNSSVYAQYEKWRQGSPAPELSIQELLLNMTFQNATQLLTPGEIVEENLHEQESTFETSTNTLSPYIWPTFWRTRIA